MKKLLSVILTVALLAGCFVACNSQPPKVDSAATPTAVEPTKEQVEDVVAVPDEQEQKTENKQQVEENQEPQESVVENKPVTEKKPQKQEAEKQEKPVASNVKDKDSDESSLPSLTPEEIHEDVGRKLPGFVSEQALQVWLTKGSGAYEAERSAYLTQATKNNAVTYYRPSESLLNIVSLKKIEFHEPSRGFEFIYSFDNGAQLNVNIGTAQIPGFYENRDMIYGVYKEAYENGDKAFGYYKDEKNNLDYYWEITDNNLVLLKWMQFGLAHSARFPNQFDLYEILPCLALEQVTINLNSDHVTQ